MWSIKSKWSMGSVTTYICAISVMVAGLAACLTRGFFFTEEMYSFLTVWFMLCSMIAIFLLIQGYRENKRGGEQRETRRSGALRLEEKRLREGRILGIRAVCIVLSCPLVVLFLYILLWIRGPLSAQGTMNEILRWGLYGSFACIAYFSAKNYRGARFLIAGWSVLGMVISLSALFAVCGLLKLPFAVAFSHTTEVSVTGARLGGLLEYPNTFGAVMAVFLVERLFAAATYYARTETRVKGITDFNSGTASKETSEHEGVTWSEAERASKVSSGAGRASVRQVDAELSEAVTASKETSEHEGVRRREAETSSERRVDEERSEAGTASKETSGHEGVTRSEAERASKERSEAGRASEEQGYAGTTAAALLRLLPLFPYAAALLLSESRGAWLAAASACAATLIWKRQLIAPLLAAGAAPLAAAALLYRQLARAGLAVEPLPGLLWLAGLWAGALLAGLWLCRRQRSAGGGTRAAMLALAAVGWTAAGTAVLLHVRERIMGPSSTVSARGLFYRDAWRLAAEAPWLGRGGETWRSSYLAIQSRPYVGSQVHNGYLDILLNLGFVGLAAILLMLFAIGWMLATTSPRLLPPFLVIVLHSAVDFDWSYGLVWLLLFWLPALAFATRLTSSNPLSMVYPTSANQQPNVHLTSSNPLSMVYPTSQNPQPNVYLTSPNPLYMVYPKPSVALQTTAKPRYNISPPLANRLRFYTKRWFAVVVYFVCLMLALLSFHAEKGVQFYQKALQASTRVEKEELLQQSLVWNPLSVRTAVELSRLLPAEQRDRVLGRSLLYSQENADLNWAMAEHWMRGHNPGTALYWIRRSIRLDVYNEDKRLKAVKGLLAMGERKLGEGKLIEAAYCAVTGEKLLRQYQLLALLEGGRGESFNDRRFGITDQTIDLSQRLNDMREAANYNKSRIQNRYHNRALPLMQ